MNRIQRWRAIWTVAALSPALLILAPTPGYAWNSPEHEALGGTVYSLAAARFTKNDQEKLDLLDPAKLASWSALFEKGVAEPDYCHSYWHSNYAKGAVPCAPGGCKIKSGVPVSIAPTETFYGLSVNESHFGELTQLHWSYFDALALAAATRYRDTCNDTCRDLAVTLEAFAQHYLTDRTASGHAFSDDPDGWVAGLTKMDGMRGCFHGQPGYKDFFIGLGTAFECKNWAWGADRGSLGESARRFGNPYFILGAQWWSDDNLAKGGATQKSLSVAPGVDALERVFARMLCKKEPAIHWTDTFVSNRDMCQVMLGQCCVSTSGASGISCTYCQPHITNTELTVACPIQGKPKYSPGKAGIWTKLRDNLWVELAWPGQGIGGWAGTFVAEQLSRGPASVNPDARYNTISTVLMAAGCLSSGLSCGAPLKNKFCDSWPCNKPKINFCRGILPARPCAPDPCGEYYLHTTFVPKSGAIGECVCKKETGDGVCSVDEGENFTNSPSDCGADRLYCGDGYCNKGAGEQEYTCPEDCAKFGGGGLVCGTLGPKKYPLAPACGNGVADWGESCQLCPKEKAWGPTYAGISECSKSNPGYGAKFFSDHGCSNPLVCITTANGGWCAGFCDDVEGCVPGQPVNCSGVNCESDPADKMKCNMLTEKELCDDCNSTKACDGTASVDCTLDYCDKSKSPMGECKHTTVCCDDCDGCNGYEYFDYDAMSCEGTDPDVLSPCTLPLCGEHPNACGTLVDCGGCPPGQVCNDGVCCTPMGCTSGLCGEHADGCGGTMDCGPCADCGPLSFVDGVNGGICPDVFSPDGITPDILVTDAWCLAGDSCCAPISCLPGMCDWYDNGCGGVVDCGTCPLTCGNMICDPVEVCTCPLDCGPCEVCGDGTCGGTETCETCPSDCGFCSDTIADTIVVVGCGDGLCNGGETCGSCPIDCGMCADAGAVMYCGDGACNGGEMCFNCPTDCGMCADAGPSFYCGDGVCNGGETCTGCSIDCGFCPSTCTMMCAMMCPPGSGYSTCCANLCGL